MMDSLVSFLEMNFIFILGSVILAIAVYFVGKIILKCVDALLDRYRAKTDLIRAQAEQARKDALK